MTSPRPVLILDDDPALRAVLAARLGEDATFRATEAATVAQARALLDAPDARFDALILDVSLPDGDGCELCARLRGEGWVAPILMLTGRDAEGDVVRGLDAGASDYVAKPFRAAELLARLRAQLRASEASNGAVLPIGPYLFRPAVKLLHDPAKGRRIRLTDKETGILRHLLRAGGRVVGREVLLREVWGYRKGVSTHTLETHIYRLRQKIEPTPSAPRLLVTVGRGYRLDAAPEAGFGPPAPAASAAPAARLDGLAA